MSISSPIAQIARMGDLALRPWSEREAQRLDGLRRHHALDPFALANGGLAIILDLETLEEKPLVLWEHQREVISSWIDLAYLAEHERPHFRNVHEEKSRQMGLTWVTAYVCLWALNFHNLAGLALSQKLGEVCDSGPTTDSFFGKVRFMWERLPIELRAPLLFTGGNDPSIRNPAMPNSFLAGEGATPDAGRGGKYDYVFLDEAARIPWGRIVHTAVSRACPSGRFYNSTPKGEDALYYWLREKRPRGYIFLRHHWSLNPVYAREIHVAALSPSPDTAEPGALAVQPTFEMQTTAEACELCHGTTTGVVWDPNNPQAHRFPGRLTSPWYEQAIVELTDEQVAQELDIDYAGSLPARVYTEWSDERNLVPHIPYDPTLPIELCWDYGWSMNAVGILQESQWEYRMIGEFERPDLLPEQVVAGLKEVLLSIGVERKNLATHNTLAWLCRGDVAGEATSMATGRSIVNDYRRLGFAIHSQPYKVDRTIVAMKRLLLGRPKLMVVSAETCPNTARHFRMNKWETDREGARKPNARLQNDEHNHMLRALAYIVTYKFPPPAERGGSEPPPSERQREETGKVDPGLTYSTRF